MSGLELAVLTGCVLIPLALAVIPMMRRPPPLCHYCNERPPRIKVHTWYPSFICRECNAESIADEVDEMRGMWGL